MATLGLLGTLPVLAREAVRVLDRFIPDPQARQQAATEITATLIDVGQRELAERAATIRAEIAGESWLQRSWRPLVMLWLAGLVGAYWLGITPTNLPPSAIDGLLDIVQIGLGGYVVGRSAEKVARIWKEQ